MKVGKFSFKKGAYFLNRCPLILTVEEFWRQGEKRLRAFASIALLAVLNASRLMRR